jgi:hypothetical protein
MLRRSSRSWLGPLTLVAALLAFGSLMTGCSKKAGLVTDPTSGIEVAGSGGTFVLRPGDQAFQAAVRVQNLHTPELLEFPGVVGTAITADATGRPAILVMTENALPAGRLPAALEGFKVIEEVTGKIVAMKGSGGGVSHTAKQTPPIQLGTSGGSVVDVANGYCCSGTLGALVQKNGVQYILSNSHVLAGDVVAGGNGKVSAIGDDVTQPGYVDINCSATGANLVADVSSLSTLYPPGSTPNVDCAMAQVRSGMVRTDGAILEIGTLSAQTVAAFVGQLVKKSGRTTGLTRSTISGLNATVNVGYETECGGGSFTKTFTGQIVVANSRSKFLNSGDSGSLMVEDVTTNPRAIGLLFAGSSTTAIANPIGDVLSRLGVTMVGN